MEKNMIPRILSEVPLIETAVQKLEVLPRITVQQLPPHDSWWDLPNNLIPGPEILLCKFPPRNIDMMNRLKLVQLSSVGYEHLRHLRFADRPVRVCNARGVFDTAIGEWNLAMMVNLIRDLPGMLRNQEKSRWDRADRFQQELRGRVLGLWGYGGIGRETARLAKVLGMTVHVLTRSGLKPRPNRNPAGSSLCCRSGKRVSVRPGFPGLGFTSHSRKRRHDWGGGAENPASDGVHPEPGPRTNHPGKSTDPSASRRLDCRRCFGHTVRLPPALGSSLVAVSQRDPDPAHLRGRQESQFPRPHRRFVHPKRQSLPG